MILLTDTFGVEQLADKQVTIRVNKISTYGAQVMLKGGFQTYFEFEELAFDAQQELGIEVPRERNIQRRPQLAGDFDLVVVGIVAAADNLYAIEFWWVSGSAL